eukprot:COSAG05_NODE_377_length_10608_cov_17.523361_7_plen_108_part_00
MLDEHKIDSVWPIISNREAIAVNQAWFDSPGQLLTSRDVSLPADSRGFVNYTSALQVRNARLSSSYVCVVTFSSFLHRLSTAIRLESHKRISDTAAVRVGIYMHGPC